MGDLAPQIENADILVACEVLLARLKLAQGDVAGAAALLAQAGQSARQQHVVYRLPEIAAAQVLILLHQGNLAAAAQLAQTYDLPLSQARVHLAQGNPSAALAVLEPWRRQVEAKGWADERLKVLLLQALAHYTQGDTDQAVQVLGDALALAEPDGFIRTFVDEGLPMAHLLAEAAARGLQPEYLGKVPAAAASEKQRNAGASTLLPPPPHSTPSSPREVEVLHLIAQGRSNQEIGEQLFLAVSTVKRHNLNIFAKLQVQRRTEAVVRARELGLL